MTPQTVLVTGASGLVGSGVVAYLLEQGFCVVGLSKHYPRPAAVPAGTPAYVPVAGDVRDGALLARLFADYRPAYVIHLAAQALVGDAARALAETFDTNVRGTWCVLEAASQSAGLRGIVVASSDKAYGEHATLPYREDFPLNALHPYDLSKRMTEDVALAYARVQGLPVAITRCGNVFGPGDLHESRLVPGAILAFLRGRRLVLRSDGSSERCYVYVRDVARAYHALMLAAGGVAAGEVFNVGNDRPVSTLDMATRIAARMGRGRGDIVVEGSASGEIARQCLDCTKIRRLLGWEESVDLDSALDLTIDWYVRTFGPAGKHAGDVR